MIKRLKKKLKRVYSIKSSVLNFMVGYRSKNGQVYDHNSKGTSHEGIYLNKIVIRI